MSEDPKKMDLFQLIALIVIVGSVFLGLYYTNMLVSARFDSLETALAGNTTTLETLMERLDRKVKSLEEAAAAKADAPEDAAADEGAAAPAEEAEADDNGEAEKAADETAEGDTPDAKEAEAPEKKDAKTE